jgi:diacyltrehalose acyltransferase
MRPRLRAGLLVAGVACSAVGYAPVLASSEPDVVYAVGGARAPGIPWYDYTKRAASGFYPHAGRQVIDYPAGAPFSWVPTMFDPGPRDHQSVGVAAGIATSNLDNAVRGGTAPAAAVGLSQGSLALDQEQARLANDPTAPARDMLQFTTIGDPAGQHAFGASFASGMFAPGSYIPVVDYTMPAAAESQYDSTRIVTAYDGFADFPDRPANPLALANAAVALYIAHTPAAFTKPSDVPPENVRAVVNSRGATTTTYLIPVNHLPLTLPLRYLGWSDGLVNQIDAILQPQIDAGYSRNDNLLNRPTTVEPNGMDPVNILDPGTRDSIQNAFAQLRGILPPPPG